MLNPTDQEFSIIRTIGRGNSHPGDVVRLRRALNRTGYGRFPQNPAKNVTPGLMQATERFQRDFALKPDGVVEPAGPTERMMRIVERTDREIGEDGVRVLSEAVRRLNEAGFEFLPDPARPRAGMFVNERGQARRARGASRRSGEIRTDTVGGGGQTRGCRRSDRTKRSNQKCNEGLPAESDRGNPANPDECG